MNATTYHRGKALAGWQVHTLVGVQRNECGPTMVRHQLLPTQAAHVLCNRQEQHCFEKACENCGLQTNQPTVGSFLVRTPGVTVVHTGSNRKGTGHMGPPVV